MDTYDFKADYPALLKNRLFEGFDAECLMRILPSLNPEIGLYEKGEVVFRSSKRVQRAGLLLEGKAVVNFVGIKGENVRMRLLTPGQIFMLEPALLNVMHPQMFYIQTLRRSRVFWFELRQLQKKRMTVYERRLMNNVGIVMAERNVEFYNKIYIYSQKHIRDRLRTYISMQPMVDGAYVMTLSQTDLAMELGVDRSALSRELARLQQENVLKIEGRRIQVLAPDSLAALQDADA